MVAETSQTDTKVQADPGTPAGRALMREEAIAAAREEMPDVDKGEPKADVDGTDEAEANESAEAKGDESPEASEEAPAEKAEPEPQESEDTSTEDEVDWSNADQRTAELKRIADEHETNTRERLDNQKRSMVGERKVSEAAAEAATAEVRQTALVRELDELSDSDPEAFAQRVKNDPEASEALNKRHRPVITAEQQKVLIEQAKLEVVTFQGPQMFMALDGLEQVAAAQGEEWQKATDPTTGGIFGHIAREKLAEGIGLGEEKYKQSAAFKNEIAQAEQRGKQDALTESGMGSPPSNDDSTPTEEPAPQKYDDIRQQAAADALAELAKRGNKRSINPSDIPKRRRSAAVRS